MRNRKPEARLKKGEKVADAITVAGEKKGDGYCTTPKIVAAAPKSGST